MSEQMSRDSLPFSRIYRKTIWTMRKKSVCAMPFRDRGRVKTDLRDVTARLWAAYNSAG
jgi:hypothetical protein